MKTYRGAVERELAHWPADMKRSGAVIRAIELGITLGLEAAAESVRDALNDDGESIRNLDVLEILRFEPVKR